MLAHLDPQTPVASYDHRGGWGGRSNTLTGPFDLEQLAADATAVITALQTDVILVGHSMGGKVAQLVAAGSPSALTGLILIAPAPPGPADHSHAGVPTRTRARLRQPRDRGRRARSRPYGHCTADLRALGGHRGQSFGRCGGPHGVATSRHRREHHTGAERISAATTVIAGGRDLVEPVEVLRRHLLPFIPHAHLRVLDAVGHLIPLEAPMALAQQLTRNENRGNP